MVPGARAYVRQVIVAFLLGLIWLHPYPAPAQTLPALPQATVVTTMPSVTGNSYTVNAGGNLQDALNQAAAANPNLTHEIILQSGATFTGNFILPSRSAGSGWVIVRTSNLGGIPAEGNRATPAHASSMPTLNTGTNGPIIANTDGSNRYRFTGIRFNVASNVTAPVYYLVEMRGGNTNRIVFDRVLVDNPNNKVMASAVFALHIDHWGVINSTFTNLTGVNSGWETKAMGSWERTSGPVLIDNNYISASAIGVLLGGGAARQGITVNDVTIRRNHFYKNPAWVGAGLGTKNHIELKLGARVLIEGNIFENSWLDAQFYALVFNAYDPVNDITVRFNKIRNAYWLVEMNGEAGVGSGNEQRIYFHDNLFEGYGGRGFLIWDTARDVVIDHNTFIGPNPQGPFIIFGGGGGNEIHVTNNIAHDGGYGIFYDGGGTGAAALNAYAVAWTSAKNVAVAGTDAKWSTGNFYPSSFSQVGFENYAGGDYRLASSSPYKNAGTDDKDIGADIATLNAATAGVIGGTGTSESSTPTPPPGLRLN